MWNSSQQLLLRSSDRISIPDKKQELDTLQGLVYFLLLLNSLTVIHLIYCWNIRFQASSSHSKIASLKKKRCVDQSGFGFFYLPKHLIPTTAFFTECSVIIVVLSTIISGGFWKLLTLVVTGRAEIRLSNFIYCRQLELPEKQKFTEL